MGHWPFDSYVHPFTEHSHWGKRQQALPEGLRARILEPWFGFKIYRMG